MLGIIGAYGEIECKVFTVEQVEAHRAKHGHPPIHRLIWPNAWHGRWRYYPDGSFVWDDLVAAPDNNWREVALEAALREWNKKYGTQTEGVGGKSQKGAD